MVQLQRGDFDTTWNDAAESNVVCTDLNHQHTNKILVS